MSKIRVGVIGVGAIAQMGHLPFYKANPDVELVAVVDLNETRAREIAEKFDVKNVYSDALAMLQAEHLDAVSICTTNQSHATLAKLAFEYGADVLVEKPLCVDPKDAWEVVDLAERSGRICMVGMTHRFRNESKAIKRFVDAGDLGQIYYAKAKILRRRGTPTGWFTDSSHSGGGPLMDIGVHALDLAWWILGTPTPVRTTGYLVQGIGRYDTMMASRWKSMNEENQNNEIFDVEDFASAIVHFDKGFALHLEVSWALNGPQDDALKLDIFGKDGGVSLDPLRYYSEKNQILLQSDLSVQVNNPYEDEISHFVSCVQERTTPISSAKQGAQVVEMLSAISRSSREKREVR